MTVILDAGSLVALERGDSAMWRWLKVELSHGRLPVTHGGIVGQVWRGGGPRQANLARALDAVEVVAIDDALGRQAGRLLASTGLRDVVDAALVALAGDDDEIATSDPLDIQRLVLATGRHIDVVPV